jgi:hypothetical protein
MKVKKLIRILKELDLEKDILWFDGFNMWSNIEIIVKKNVISIGPNKTYIMNPKIRKNE